MIFFYIVSKSKKNFFFRLCVCEGGGGAEGELE